MLKCPEKLRAFVLGVVAALRSDPPATPPAAETVAAMSDEAARLRARIAAAERRIDCIARQLVELTARVAKLDAELIKARKFRSHLQALAETLEAGGCPPWP